MRADIHPQYQTITVTCSCGNVFPINSSMTADFTADVCDQCHPFYTKKQKLIDTAGRVEGFKERFGDEYL